MKTPQLYLDPADFGVLTIRTENRQKSVVVGRKTNIVNEDVLIIHHQAPLRNAETDELDGQAVHTAGLTPDELVSKVGARKEIVDAYVAASRALIDELIAKHDLPKPPLLIEEVVDVGDSEAVVKALIGERALIMIGGEPSIIEIEKITRRPK